MYAFLKGFIINKVYTIKLNLVKIQNKNKKLYFLKY